MGGLPLKRRDNLLLTVPRLSFKPSLLTSRSRFLLEKFSSSATPKFFTAYGDQTTITEFTEARYFSLCRARLIQSTPSHPVT